MTTATLAELPELAGTDLGRSEWREITQQDVDDFGRVTDDAQWIHVDPERAAAGPFGTTIAHGFLTLSLVPALLRDVLRVEGVAIGINYGLNRVRFPAPLPVGSRIRLGAKVDSVEEVQPGVWQVVLTSTVEREGSDKPVCVVESVVRFIGSAE